MRRILAAVEQGDALADALKREKEFFPPLLLALAGVGEETGQLPEVFGELEKYYLLQQRLKRQFRSQSMLPVIQFILAVFIIAGMLFVIGLINASKPGQSPVFGIRGPGPAWDFPALGCGHPGPAVPRLSGPYPLPEAEGRC